MEKLPNIVLNFIEILSYLFILVVGLLFLWVACMYVVDKFQTNPPFAETILSSRVFAIGSSIWGSFSVNIFSLMIGKKCRSTAPRVHGFIALQKT